MGFFGRNEKDYRTELWGREKQDIIYPIPYDAVEKNRGLFLVFLSTNHSLGISWLAASHPQAISLNRLGANNTSLLFRGVGF